MIHLINIQPSCFPSLQHSRFLHIKWIRCTLLWSTFINWFTSSLHLSDFVAIRAILLRTYCIHLAWIEKLWNCTIINAMMITYTEQWELLDFRPLLAPNKKTGHGSIRPNTFSRKEGESFRENVNFSELAVLASPLIIRFFWAFHILPRWVHFTFTYITWVHITFTYLSWVHITFAHITWVHITFTQITWVHITFI